MTNKFKAKSKAELAKALDDDIDNFIEGLVSKRKDRDAGKEPEVQKPFDLKEWMNEIDKHPLFLDQQLSDGDDHSEAISALQSLKYDGVEDPKEAAEFSKQEGNRHFKHKQYRSAVKCYTDGLRQFCVDNQLNGELSGNRAAANFHLSNHRAALRDCQLAIRLSDGHSKAFLRGAECLIRLGQCNRAVRWIQAAPDLPDNQVYTEKMKELRTTAENGAKIESRNERKQKIVAEKQLKYRTKLLNCLRSRKIKFEPDLPDTPEEFDESMLEVRLPQLHDLIRVDFSAESADPDHPALVWPVLFCYPAANQTDFIRAFDESCTIREQLAMLFESPPAWDPNGRFNVDSVRVTFEDLDKKTRVVNLDMTLAEVLRSEHYTVTDGLPVFAVILK